MKYSENVTTISSLFLPEYGSAKMQILQYAQFGKRSITSVKKLRFVTVPGFHHYRRTKSCDGWLGRKRRDSIIRHLPSPHSASRSFEVDTCCRPRARLATMAPEKKSSRKKSTKKDFGTSWPATNPSSSSRSCPPKTYVTVYTIHCVYHQQTKRRRTDAVSLLPFVSHATQRNATTTAAMRSSRSSCRRTWTRSTSS